LQKQFYGILTQGAKMFDKGLEEWKYRKIYQKEGILSKGSHKDKVQGTYDQWEKLGKAGKWEKYGHSNEGREHYDEVISLKPESLLDVGCGWNEFCISLKRGIMKGKKCVGVDIACPGSDFIAPAHNMPMFKNKEFDLVTSFDCIEHIPEEEVEVAFKEFARVGKRVFLKICLENSPTTIDNSPVHVCIRPKDWWISKAEEYFSLDKIYVHGTAKFDPVQGKVIYNFAGDRARSLVLEGYSINE